jgi:hypothetical protein
MIARRIFVLFDSMVVPVARGLPRDSQDPSMSISGMLAARGAIQGEESNLHLPMRSVKPSVLPLSLLGAVECVSWLLKTRLIKRNW